jgi:DNA mismatch repair protein MutS2
MHEVIEAKGKIKKLKEDETDVVLSENGDIEVGSYVAITDLGITGKIEKISGNRLFIVSPDGLKITSTREKVHLVGAPAPEKAEKTFIAPQIVSDVKLELNVIGLRVDEALEEVARYLDGVRLKHFSQVRIIHVLEPGL